MKPHDQLKVFHTQSTGVSDLIILYFIQSCSARANNQLQTRNLIILLNWQSSSFSSNIQDSSWRISTQSGQIKPSTEIWSKLEGNCSSQGIKSRRGLVTG